MSILWLTRGTRQVFYVGKGSKRRAWQHETSARNGRVDGTHLKCARIAEVIAADLSIEVKIIAECEIEGDEVTLESLLAELEEARSLAMTEKQSSAAVSATMGKAKLTGLLVEKLEHTATAVQSKPTTSPN